MNFGQHSPDSHEGLQQVAYSQMIPKSVSLTAQLLLTLVSLVIGTAAVLTVEAYRSSRQTLEEEARRTVHVAAEQLEQTLARHLDLREQQAEGFLSSVESLC